MQSKANIEIRQQSQNSSKSVNNKKGKLPEDEELNKLLQEYETKRKVPNIIFQSGFQERKWFKKHKMEDRIPFKDDQITKLRQYFTSLDEDGSGSIGLDELQDPLVALGLAQTRDEVDKMIQEVDDDGQIEFNEFLSIMTNMKKSKIDTPGQQKGEMQEKSPIYDFFKKMSDGQLGEDMEKDVPFKLNVSLFRRRKILDAITELENKDKKERGNKIMQAFKRQLMYYKQQEKVSKGEDPNDISLDNIPNNDNGVNPRNGFPRLNRIIQPDQRFMKPKPVGK